MTPLVPQLRLARADDAAALAELYALPEVARQTLSLGLPDLALWQQRCSPQPGEQSWMLVAEHAGQLLGQASLVRHGRPRRMHAAALAMMVHPGFFGRGIGSALLGRICELAFQGLGLRRLELEVNIDNQRAIALYQRHGFVTEGRLRGYALRDGELIDVLSMARLAAAPPFSNPNPELPA